MWLYRNSRTKYQIGYLVFGIYFKVIEEFDNKDDAEMIVSYLNGGELA